MAKNREAVWRVTHPDHQPTVVRAADWKLATVEAADWWGVPWKSVAAECTANKLGDLPRNVCARCGKIFHSEGLLCEMCSSIEKTAELNRRANDRRFWREMGPKKG